MKNYINNEKVKAVHYDGKNDMELAELLIKAEADFEINSGVVITVNKKEIKDNQTYFTTNMQTGVFSGSTDLFKKQYKEEIKVGQG